MIGNSVLFTITTKGPALMSIFNREVLEVTEKGIHYTNKGILSALLKKDLFIPYDQVSGIEVENFLMGIQYNFVITSTSGTKLKIKNVHKEQATEAKRIIYDTQKKIMHKFAPHPGTAESNHQPVDVADQILKLSKLRDAGILTQDQFDTQKQKLLNL